MQIRAPSMAPRLIQYTFHLQHITRGSGDDIDKLIQVTMRTVTDMAASTVSTEQRKVSIEWFQHITQLRSHRTEATRSWHKIRRSSAKGIGAAREAHAVHRGPGDVSSKAGP